MTPADPASYAIVVGTLAVTALLAATGPLGRALGLQPLRALRAE